MPFRPLLLVAALAGGDYLLWTWSSDGDSTTVALISGLALAPLILALVWLLSVGVARTLLVRSAGRRPMASASARRRGSVRGRSPLARRRVATRGGSARSASAAHPWEEGEEPSARAPAQQAASEKIAA